MFDAAAGTFLGCFIDGRGLNMSFHSYEPRCKPAAAKRLLQGSRAQRRN